MKHSRSKNAVLLMIIFICSICLNNVWARETGTMDQLEKENPDDVDKMNKVLYYYNTLFFESANEGQLGNYFLKFRKSLINSNDRNAVFIDEVANAADRLVFKAQEVLMMG